MTAHASEITAPEQPRLWRLAIQLEPGLLRAVMWSTVEDASLRQFSIPLDPTLRGHKALEEAVYAAPVLLSDFARVDVVVRTSTYMVLPGAVDVSAARDALGYACIVDNADAGEVFVDRISSADVSVAWALDAATAGFLARTVRNPAVHCHIAPLLRYFSRKTLLGNSGKLYAHINECGGRREIDLMAFDAEGSLAMAATHTVGADTDVLYYVFAFMKQAGLDVRNDELLVCGHQATRDAVMPLLRRYAAYVMPVIFPSAAFRAGRDALQAPFPLVILPLCE